MEPTTSGGDTVDGSATPEVRASHADRERVAAVLHTAAGDGLLTMDEVEVRLAAAYAARYRGELEVLTSDLPAGNAEDRDPPGWAAVGAAAALQLRSTLGPASGRHRGMRAVLAHPVIVTVVAAVVLALLVLAASMGADFD